MSRLGRLLVAHPWIVYALLAALAFPVLEILVHGERALQYAHDVFDDDVPRLFALAADWRANGPVLWDPHLTAGNAWAAQSAQPPLSPDAVLSFVVAPFVAYTANTALMIFAAGVSMHLFLRDSVRLPAIACFAGGILATFAFWHYILGYAVLLLPLVLWSTDRALAEGRRRRDVVVAILVVAFLLVTSLVQIVLIGGLVALGWVLVTKDPARSRTARVAGLIGIWVMAALLAAPILLSLIAAVPESQRANWDLGYLFPVGPNLETFAQTYGGILFGAPLTDGIGGSADTYGSFFLGALGLALLVVGIVAPRRSGRERFLLALLVLIPVIDIVAIVAAPLQEHVTLLRSFQFIRVRHLMPIVLIVNAAIGLAWLLGPDPIGGLSPRRRTLAALGLGAVGLAIAAQVIVAAAHVVRQTGGDVVRAGWSLTLVALAGAAILTVAIALAVFVRRRRGSGTGPILVGGLVVLLVLGLAGERLLHSRAERWLGGNLGTWAASVAPSPAHAFIASQPGGGRVLSIGEHANHALSAGLDAVDGYQTIYPLRYHELFGALIAPQLALDPERAQYYDGWGNRAYAFGPAIDMDVADLLGVRWLYVRGDPPEDPALVARFRDGGVTVYENPGAFPRAFIAHDIDVVPDRTAVIAALSKGSVDELRNRVYLAAADLPAQTQLAPGSPPSASDTTTIETDANDRIVIRANTSMPGYLVLADTYTSDWIADVDGQPAPVLALDGALRGVVLAPGDHRVTFTYRPVATYAGIGLAALATVLLIGWLVLGWRRRAGARPLERLEPSSQDRASAPPN